MRNPPTLLSLTIDSTINNFSSLPDISFLPEHILLELLLRTLKAGKLNERILKLFVNTGKEEILSAITALNIKHITHPVLPTREDIFEVKIITCVEAMKMSLLLSARPPSSSFPRTASFSTCSLSPTAFNITLQLIPMRLPFRAPCTFASASGRKESSQLSSQVSNPSLGSPLETETWSFEVGKSSTPVNLFAAPKLTFGSQALLLICCTSSLAFTGFAVAALPTLLAMRRAAMSLSKLADTACEEIPSTVAALRLSGMEISDLTLELSDLSQEITETVAKSAQAVEAAEAEIRQMGSAACRSTISMIQERASLPVIPLRPIVIGAAKKTFSGVDRAAKTILRILSRRQDEDSTGEDSNSSASGC